MSTLSLSPEKAQEVSTIQREYGEDNSVLFILREEDKMLFQFTVL